MAKYCGKIGYAVTKKMKPGVFVEVIDERQHFGDLVTNTVKIQNRDVLNDDIVIANDISIVADPYAKQNFHSIRYATYMGVKWKVTMVKEAYPRLILVLGGVYNESDGSKPSEASGTP